MDQQEVQPRTGRRGQRRRRRIALIVAGAVLAVVVLAVILAPAIGSSIAPGIVREELGKLVKGRVTVGRVGLSWFGKQTAGPITIADESGKPVAKINVEASSGLLGLVKGGLGLGAMDVGTVTITGEATVVRHKDGTTNIEDLLKPSAPSSGGPAGGQGGAKKPASLPRGLTGQVVVESFMVALIDEDGPRQVDIANLTMKASFGNGNAAVELAAPATLTESGVTRPAGTLKIDASVTGLADAAGVLTPESAIVDATVEAGDLSTQVAGILTGLGDRLVAGLGETMRVSAKIKGGLASGDATVSVVSKGLNADLGLKASDGSITNSRPGSVQISGDVVRAFSADLERTAPNFALTAAPDVSVSLDSLTIPRSGGKVDMARAAAVLSLRTTAISGTVTVADQPARRIDVSPLEATIDARDPAAAMVKAKASVQLDGAPAGSLVVDLLAENPFAGGVPALSGRASLNDLSTVAAQPFVESLGLDLPAGVGPRMFVIVTAAQADGKRTDIDVKVQSAGVNGAAAISYDGLAVSLRAPAEFSLRSPQALIGKAMEKQGGLITPGGFAKVSVKSLSASVGDTMMDTLATETTVSFGGFSVGTVAASKDAVAIQQFVIEASAKGGESPRVVIQGAGSHTGGEFSIAGDVTAEGLFTAREGGGRELTPGRTRPVGTIRVTNAPTSLFALAQSQSPDTLRLVRDAIGPTMNIAIEAKPGASGKTGRAILLTAGSAHMNGRAAVEVSDASLAVSAFEFRSAVSPELVATLLDMAGPQLESKPALAGPAAIMVSIEPFSAPIKDGELRMAEAGDAKFKVGLEGRTRITNLQVEDKDGRKRDLGVVDLENVLIQGNLPLASFAGGAAARPMEVTLSGSVLGEGDQRIAGINGSVKASIAEGAPVGDLAASLTMAVHDAARLDTILDRPGFVTGAVGEKLDIQATAAIQFAKAGGKAASVEEGTFDVSITSPRVVTVRPLKAMLTSGEAGTGSGGVATTRIVVDSPMILTWNADAAWLNTYIIAGPKPDPKGLQVTGSPVLTLKLLKLHIPIGGDGLYMKPGEFLADAEITTPELNLTADGSTGAVKAFAARVAGGREPGVIGFNVRADDLGSGPGPNAAQALLMQGGLYKVADAEGRLTTDAAVLSMTGDAYGAPTALLDALAQQGGWLSEALGPMVTLKVRTEGANKERGNVVLTANSPRAEVEIKGMIKGGTFLADGEPKITLHTITPEMGKMLVNGLPLIGTFEKKAEDGPTVVSATALSIPMDGKVERFSGEIKLDIGTARFETSRIFGAVLKAIKQRETGLVGRKLEPLTLSVKNGVITYPRWKLPLGDFSVDTRGTVDLVNRKLEFITYIPFGALSDEAAGRLSTGLGRLLGSAVPLVEQATMIPFRTTGSFEDAKTEVDLELYAKEAGKTLLRPDLIIREQLQDLFKRDGK